MWPKSLIYRWPKIRFGILSMVIYTHRVLARTNLLKLNKKTTTDLILHVKNDHLIFLVQKSKVIACGGVQKMFWSKNSPFEKFLRLAKSCRRDPSPQVPERGGRPMVDSKVGC